MENIFPMHLESPMFLFDTNNMANLNQNNEVFDSEIFLSRFEYNYCIYFQVTKNTIYLFSEKIIRICIFENGWVWVNSFEIGACWVPSKLSIDFLDPIIPVFAPKFSRQTMLSDDGHFKLIPRDWNKFEKAY